ncbi:hypothetical protein GH714_006742 [Hevea brasiliensis]|uniref:GST C-terminal domain-containing protein n=1 Tax=Hevea brasiliensis TaxID=3981 RepID=A0A6A6MA53_HEVBR|nr:hypothetical protein GH714_006742 [Hevea brasiliensis]
MRRVNGLATLTRNIAAASSAAAGATSRHLLVQAAMMSTWSCTNSSQRIADRFGISNPSVASGVAGTMFFSVAASSLEQEVHAKEPPPAEKFLLRMSSSINTKLALSATRLKVSFNVTFLDYYNIPYKVVEVNPISKKEIKWSDYKKVPILTVDGEQMVDSSDIIDKLLQRIHPDNSITSADEESKWRGWVDNHLVHVLSPNIYRTTSEALESFDYITTHGNFSFTERLVAKYAGAAAMYFVSKKLKKRHNITDERAALYDAAETWVDALEGREYLGGSKPNLADLAVFGVLRPIRYLKSGKDMVEHTHIGEWYSRMEQAVGEPARIKA